MVNSPSRVLLFKKSVEITTIFQQKKVELFCIFFLLTRTIKQLGSVINRQLSELPESSKFLLVAPLVTAAHVCNGMKNQTAPWWRLSRLDRCLGFSNLASVAIGCELLEPP